MSQITNDMDALPQEVDIIICGGGAAGGLLAGRLAKANPELEILIIEAGADNHNNPTVDIPAVFLHNLVPTSTTARFYKSRPCKSVDGREVVVPVAEVLGGGSSINWMMYTRAQATDFDSWQTEGWSSDELIPLLKKTETYHPTAGSETDMTTHGECGEFQVSDGTYVSETLRDDILQAAGQMGYRTVADCNDLKTVDAVAPWKKWISPEGERQDVPRRILRPLLSKTKLNILTHHAVSRVVLEEKRAVGVEVVKNTSAPLVVGLTEVENTPLIVKARKLVVLSSGALGTPQILERSGLGDATRLEKLDIETVVDLPGVGENYQDHQVVGTTYSSKLKEDETVDCLLSGRLSLEQAGQQKENGSGKSILGWNSIDTCMKIRPTAEEVDTFSSAESRKCWNTDYADNASRPGIVMVTLAGFMGDPSTVPAGQYISVGGYTAYPYSRGSIHITSKSIHTSDPDFYSGFLSHPFDLDIQVWQYKKSREIARRLEYSEGPFGPSHPQFDPSSPASFENNERKSSNKRKNNERATVLQNIVYSEEDDRVIENFIKEKVTTTWHSLGTCAMKPREQGGVVDKHLNVYGVEGLKIADLSIVPENVGSNTYSTALLVGEKAATIVARDLGLEI